MHQDEVYGAPGDVHGLVWAYRFGPEGDATLIDAHAAAEALNGGEAWVWLHFSLADARAQAWIARCEALPPSAREMLLSRDSHVRIDGDAGVVSGVLADMRRGLAGEQQEVGRLHFALGARFVMSARRSSLNAVEETRQAVAAGQRMARPVSVIESMVGRFCASAAHLTQDLADEIDRIEDRLLDDKLGEEERGLTAVRRAAVRLHRHIAGLRAVFARVERQGVDDMPADVADAARRIAQRLDELHQDIYVVTDRARLLQDEVAARRAAEANRLLYLISVLTAVLVPPTLVTGIFGMNAKGLPFTDDPNGFLFAMGLCVASSLAVYVMMKRWSRPR